MQLVKSSARPCPCSDSVVGLLHVSDSIFPFLSFILHFPPTNLPPLTLSLWEYRLKLLRHILDGMLFRPKVRLEIFLKHSLVSREGSLRFGMRRRRPSSLEEISTLRGLFTDPLIATTPPPIHSGNSLIRSVDQ